MPDPAAPIPRQSEPRTPKSVRNLIKQIRVGLKQGHPHKDFEPVVARLETEVESRFASIADRQDRADQLADEHGEELEGTYSALRALASGSVSGDDAWKRAVVGLLPEVRGLDPETVKRMRDKGLGHLVDRHNHFAREAWEKWGYGEGSGDVR